MTAKTFTTGDIELELSRRLAIPLGQAHRIVSAYRESFAEAIEQHGRIEIRGFGAFQKTEAKAAKKRNPKTGGSVFKEAYTRVTMRPSKSMVIITDDIDGGKQ